MAKTSDSQSETKVSGSNLGRQAVIIVVLYLSLRFLINSKTNGRTRDQVARSIRLSVGRSVGRSIDRRRTASAIRAYRCSGDPSVGRSDGRTVRGAARTVSRPIDWFSRSAAVRSVRCTTGLSVGLTITRSVGRSVGRSIGRWAVGRSNNRPPSGQSAWTTSADLDGRFGVFRPRLGSTYAGH